ncbi:MAG TPA: sialidase family protein [Polyangiaceae bacterium]|nr:sialidase family protein [Polyangiaceae bacterium]
MSNSTARIAVVAMLFLAACEPGAVEWQGELARHPAPPDSVLASLGFDASGKLASAAADVTPPVDYQGRACAATVRFGVARDRLGRELTAAAWWSLRPDSSVWLVAALSPNRGATWSPAAPVDTVDTGTRGCARPAPAVAIDPKSGYVHVAYWLEAPEGPGVFFSHSMDEGATYHAPIPIVYGNRPSAVAIDASGDSLAVAYEDPNSASPAIGLALSRTQGHLFERKGIVASPRGARAERPLVGLQGSTLLVGWIEPGEGAGDVVVRRGSVKQLEQGG